MRIALDNGQNWRDLARWNNLDNPNVVEVGQVLRVVPPGADPAAVAARAVPSAGRVETRPLDAEPAARRRAASAPRRRPRGARCAAPATAAAPSAAGGAAAAGTPTAPRRATRR